VVTVAEATVADTGKELQTWRSFNGWQHCAASHFSLVNVQPPTFRRRARTFTSARGHRYGRLN